MYAYTVQCRFNPYLVSMSALPQRWVLARPTSLPADRRKPATIWSASSAGPLALQSMASRV